MNSADFIVVGLLLIVVFFAIRKIIKNKKDGKCNCGCSSGNCNSCKTNSEQEA